MSEGLIYYAHYGFSHLRLRGSRTRKQFLSGWETRQLKSARANVITRGPGGNSERRSIKVHAVPIVTVADIPRHCQIWEAWGRFSMGFLAQSCFSPGFLETEIHLYSARAPPARLTQHFSTSHLYTFDTIDLSSYPKSVFFFFFNSAVKARPL